MSAYQGAKMEEKCFFCGDIATESIGNKFICESCISDIYTILKREIKRDIKDELEHNRDLYKAFKGIGEESKRIRRDISDLKRKIK